MTEPIKRLIEIDSDQMKHYLKKIHRGRNSKHTQNIMIICSSLVMLLALMYDFRIRLNINASYFC